MAKKNPSYPAEIMNYTLRIPEKGGAPYVAISFCYYDEGKKYITYLGSLSEKAKPYTMERLKKIGYKGNLQGYNQIHDFINQRAGLTLKDITLTLRDDEYKGKKRLAVASFWAPEKLTENEKVNIAKNINNYFNGVHETRPITTPKAKPPVKNHAPKQDLTKSFNQDEDLPDFESDSTDDDAPF